MMAWQDQLKNDPFPWLLEPDSPGVSYLALRDLSDRPEGDEELQKARRAAHKGGPIATILDNMKGNIRLAEVEGFVTEIGSVYAWDIKYYLHPTEDGRLEKIEIELTPKQKHDSNMVSLMFGSR